jgi:hypothetical protein
METSVDDSSSTLFENDSCYQTNIDDSSNEMNEPEADSMAITHGEKGFITLSMNCTISSHRYE